MRRVIGSQQCALQQRRPAAPCQYDHKHTQWKEGRVVQRWAVTERQTEELEQIQWEVTKLVRQLRHKPCEERMLRERGLFRLEKTRARGHPVPTRLLARS